MVRGCGAFSENIARWLVFGLLAGIVSTGASAYLLQAGCHLCFHPLVGYAMPGRGRSLNGRAALDFRA